MLNLKSSRLLSCGLALSLLAASGASYAESYALQDIQLLYTNASEVDAGNGTGTKDEDLTVARFEHYGVWDYGNNYINLDVFHGKQVGGPAAGSFGADTKDQLFFVYVPRVSVPKLFGSKWTGGFVKDVYLAYRAEVASYGSFHANNIGVSVDLAVPGTAFFEQDFYARKTNYDSGTEFLSRTLWLAPFKAGQVGMHFDGLVLIKTTDAANTDSLAQLDLLFDVLKDSRLQLGARFEWHHNDDESRSSPFLMAKWIL